MVSAADLLATSKTTDIDLGLGGKTMRLTYKPGAITGTRDDAIVVTYDAETGERHEEVLGDGNTEEMARSICAIVTDWEFHGPLPLEDEPGHPVGSVVPAGERVPLDPEQVKFAPVPILVGLVQGITLDAAPDPTKRKPSRGRS